MTQNSKFKFRIIVLAGVLAWDVVPVVELIDDPLVRAPSIQHPFFHHLALVLHRSGSGIHDFVPTAHVFKICSSLPSYLSFCVPPEFGCTRALDQGLKEQGGPRKRN